MALAQSIGNEYQLFSRGKNHRKVLIRIFFYIQNYVRLFPVPLFWELWNFFVPLLLNVVDRINQKWKHATDIL